MGVSLLILISIILMVFNVVPLLFKPNILNHVLETGELVIVTRNSSTTYYEGPNGKTGFEYELASRFADSLGVKLKVITNDNLPEIFEILNTGKAHFAAAGLTIPSHVKSMYDLLPAIWILPNNSFITISPFAQEK
jgi:membrane-bound lytic murein transglycosylase F